MQIVIQILRGSNGIPGEWRILFPPGKQKDRQTDRCHLLESGRLTIVITMIYGQGKQDSNCHPESGHPSYCHMAHIVCFV